MYPLGPPRFICYKRGRHIVRDQYSADISAIIQRVIYANITLSIERAGLQGLLVDFIKVQGFLFCQLILVCKCAYLRSFSRIRKNYVQIHIPKADHFA